jgi:hypothetical protein
MHACAGQVAPGATVLLLQFLAPRTKGGRHPRAAACSLELRLAISAAPPATAERPLPVDPAAQHPLLAALPRLPWPPAERLTEVLAPTNLLLTALIPGYSTLTFHSTGSCSSSELDVLSPQPLQHCVTADIWLHVLACRGRRPSQR